MRKFAVIFVILITLLLSTLFFKLQQRGIQDLISSSGIIEETKVVITSKIGARILKQNVVEGKEVKSGEVLMELECIDLDATVLSAEAKLQAMHSQLNAQKAQAGAAELQAISARHQAEGQQAQEYSMQVQRKKLQNDNSRAKKLYADKVLDEASVETLQYSVDEVAQKLSAANYVAKAANTNAAALSKQARSVVEQVSAAEKQIKAAEADLLKAKYIRSECSIKAPREGIISLVTREVGENIMPGAILFELTDKTTTKVKFYVRNADLGKISVGKKIEFEADAFPQATFKGQISFIAEEAEFTPRNIQTKSDRDKLVYAVTAKVENTEHKLRTGMPVLVLIDE